MSTAGPLARGATRASAVVAIAMMAAACSLLPSGSTTRTYVPEIVGIVQDKQLAGSEFRYRLASGQLFSVPAGTQFLAGLDPDVGDLLIAGHAPNVWALGVPADPPFPNDTPEGCYGLRGSARATTTQVTVSVSDGREDVGLTFRKAPNWSDFGHVEGSDELVGNVTCINPDGEAFQHH